MTPQKRPAQAHTGRPRRSEPFKDEVYRQMFRLEASRPGAEMDLALALLRAWVAADSKAGNGEERRWLKKIFPICLTMIEAALQSGCPSKPSVQ
jgi:hypothetical protein